MTLGNPEAILFHLGFLPTFFDLPRLWALDAVAIIAIFVAMLGTAFALYALATSRAGAVFDSPARMRRLDCASGSLLIGAGGVVLLKRALRDRSRWGRRGAPQGQPASGGDIF
ncbi:LysE family translocator [Acidimangrovimonas pyrenivorans]|uniref:LysE family translocator n=1 Tax=Acidimangrovimonas pyrenivorans TaxID=2030798 RepID=A0ABV7ABP2_9RHOB